MGDEEDEGEPTYVLQVKGVKREEGSQQYTGQGKAFYLSGDTYDGTFVEGFRRGKGVYTHSRNGDTYDGHYEENKKHGYGKMTYTGSRGTEEDDEPDENAPARGGVYIGNFAQGLRGGLQPDSTSEGTFMYVNGDRYVGQWQAGKKHGSGTYMYAKDGTRLEGSWQAGKIVSGRWIFPNGTFYSGKFRYNKPHGQGVWVFKNGNQLVGEYVQKPDPREPPEEEEEAAEEDEEEGKPPKPDPKVVCHFKHIQDTAVRGGTMFSSMLPA
mmetsp:Transcript_12736/g.28147  ORF Transcript_12736/g.28147 Transcript_12736/m.28147 type:complete len:267 (+) Transcript_12736:71-871(+)|eukprot:CAMPEP_0170614764 /NCGR_PEP_ID=MMETSP0224-20130122/24980_1 /TAXON_ID=285029 /ORGANISM="Togula jolla, Strain CCCM 725" /LENGTH=266 /DNA_ID=CAMNT_0010940455 /DNA_START=66 /DNA_END=866 /DNA_ORIENTATION=+